jgi:putative acetyltransferase
MLNVRPEGSMDIAAIHHVHTLAFGRPNEADLVDALRHHGTLIVSLVAVRAQRVVGHIAFSPVTIGSNTSTLAAIGLAPMAVLPEYQRQGIGSQLVQAGLEACGEMRYGVVVVLGHPHFYPKFGFTTSKPYGIEWEHEVSEEVFMVKELQQGALARTRGVVQYGPEFNEV